MVKKNIMNMFIDGSCIYKLFLSANSTNSYSKIFIFIWTHEHYNRQDPQDKPFECVLTFNQSDWVKKYIELNTELRRGASCKAEEDLPKLMNNSFYGKTCEDVRCYMDVQLYVGVEDVRKLQRKINSPLFQRAK